MTKSKHTLVFTRTLEQDQFSLLSHLLHLFSISSSHLLYLSLPSLVLLSSSFLVDLTVFVLDAIIHNSFPFSSALLQSITCLSILSEEALFSVVCLFASEGPSAFGKLVAGGQTLEELLLLEEFELLEVWLVVVVELGLRFWKIIVSPFLTPRLSMLRSRSLMSKGFGGNPGISVIFTR